MHCIKDWIKSSTTSKQTAPRFRLLNMSFQPQYVLPDLLVNWPWKRVFNPMLVEVNVQANSWVESLALFEPDQLQKFKACDFSTY